MRRYRRILLVLPTLAVAVLVGACSTVPDAVPPALTSSAAEPPEMVSGTGPTGPFPGVSFPFPAEAKSVVVSFTCDGDSEFSVEVGDSMALGQAPQRGVCDGGAHDIGWPLSPRTSPDLVVSVSAGVNWTATPTFSAEPFLRQEALTAECEQFSPVYSALWNADQRYTLYSAITESEWKTRVGDALVQLQDLVSQSDRSAITADLLELKSTLTGPRVTEEALSDTDGPVDAIFASCDENQTPVAIMGEFGG